MKKYHPPEMTACIILAHMQSMYGIEPNEEDIAFYEGMIIEARLMEEAEIVNASQNVVIDVWTGQPRPMNDADKRKVLEAQLEQLDLERKALKAKLKAMNAKSVKEPKPFNLAKYRKRRKSDEPERE